jgi:hypothetical protein
MKNDIKASILSVKEDLDKISINSEVIENYNKLTCDKLDELNQLNIHQDKEHLLVALWELTRYSECYITLNYSITQEINKLNNSLKSVNDKLNNLLEACKNDNQE